MEEKKIESIDVIISSSKIMMRVMEHQIEKMKKYIKLLEAELEFLKNNDGQE